MLDQDQLSLQALKYAESKNIANKKIIDAYISGYRLRHSATSLMEIDKMINRYKGDFLSTKTHIDYYLNNDQRMDRISLGNDALDISNDLESIRIKIEKFNKRYKVD